MIVLIFVLYFIMYYLVGFSGLEGSHNENDLVIYNLLELLFFSWYSVADLKGGILIFEDFRKITYKFMSEKKF